VSIAFGGRKNSQAAAKFDSHVNENSNVLTILPFGANFLDKIVSRVVYFKNENAVILVQRLADLLDEGFLANSTLTSSCGKRN
jgi:hypothetical protein